ncbi:uncharacterized protein LOC144097382 [Amblyomma americanum]
MGTVGEGLTRRGLAEGDAVEAPDVDDLLNCARVPQWEEAALPLLSKGLRFFVLLQDKINDPESNTKFTEELRSRLRVAEKANKHPAFAIVFCADKNYEAHEVASCFPENISVVQIDVRHEVIAQSRGRKERRVSSLCLLVVFGSPDTQFECEWSPYASCGLPAAPVALYDQLKRTLLECGGEDEYRHRGTGFPARFAIYATTAFSRAMFKRPPSLYNVTSCILWTSRLKVLRGTSQCNLPAPAYWGAMSFGQGVRATAAKYAGWTTVLQMWKHLDKVREAFGDVGGAAVLLFQEEELKAAVAKVVYSVFSEAAAVLGTACSLALDVNAISFDLEPTEEAWPSICIETSVVVVVLSVP